MIPFRTAMIIYALLAAIAFATVQGRFLALILIVLAAIAIKTALHHYREKLQ